VRYAKPATTFDEQADLLLKRGMIGDRATLIARLSFVNYYRLSAYWWPFRKPGPTALERLDEFIEGTEFTTVWDHYAFDQRLRVLVMEAIERIEVATRTQLAYHHAHAWTPDAYATNPASLPRLVSGPATDPRTHAAFLEKLHVNLQQNGDKPFVRHFKTKYTASALLPIWMAVELMSLGNVWRKCHAIVTKIDSITLSFPKSEQAAILLVQKCVRACKWIGNQGALLLEHQLAVGKFEPSQLGEERQAEQVFGQRFVRQHHGIDIAHHQATDVDHGKPCRRRLDRAVGR